MQALQQIVIVGDDEAVFLCKRMLMVQQPSDAATAGVGFDRQRILRSQKAEVVDQRAQVEEQALERPIDRPSFATLCVVATQGSCDAHEPRH